MPELAELAFELISSEDWEAEVRSILDACRRLLGGCEVYLFGSAVEGRMTGGSDVDVLIIVPKRLSNRERGELAARILEEAGVSPFTRIQLHIADRREAEWYFRHAGKVIKLLPSDGATTQKVWLRDAGVA